MILKTIISTEYISSQVKMNNLCFHQASLLSCLPSPSVSSALTYADSPHETASPTVSAKRRPKLFYIVCVLITLSNKKGIF